VLYAIEESDAAAATVDGKMVDVPVILKTRDILDIAGLAYTEQLNLPTLQAYSAVLADLHRTANIKKKETNEKDHRRNGSPWELHAERPCTR
jgi:hypothetical protein